MHNIIKDLRNISGTKAKIEYIQNLDVFKKGIVETGFVGCNDTRSCCKSKYIYVWQQS